MVSFVIPVYNVASPRADAWLNHAVASIYLQEYKGDIEIILADDGSIDSTKNSLKNISHKFNAPHRKIKLLYLPHGGIAKTLNAAIKASTGQFIFRLDADDFCDKMRVVKQLEKFDDPKVGLVTSYARIVRDDEITMEIWWTLDSHESLFKEFIHNNPICHPAVAIRREVFSTVGYYDESLLYAQDYQFWYRISKQFRIAVVSEALTYYRLSSMRVTSRNFSQQLSCSKQIKKWILSQETT